MDQHKGVWCANMSTHRSFKAFNRWCLCSKILSLLAERLSSALVLESVSNLSRFLAIGDDESWWLVGVEILELAGFVLLPTFPDETADDAGGGVEYRILFCRGFTVLKMLLWTSLLDAATTMLLDVFPITISDPVDCDRSCCCCWFDCCSLTTCWICWFGLFWSDCWFLSPVDRDISVVDIYDATTKNFLNKLPKCLGNHQHSL